MPDRFFAVVEFARIPNPQGILSTSTTNVLSSRTGFYWPIMIRTICKLIILLYVLQDFTGISKQSIGQEKPSIEFPYDAKFVAKLAEDSQLHGDAMRGAGVFSDSKLACLSCHKVGSHGGAIGPDLSLIAKDRTITHLIESLLWPTREVKAEFTTWKVLTTDGDVVTGYKVDSTEQAISLKDPASGKTRIIAKAEIEEEIAGGSLMPTGLTALLTRQQQLDLIRFLNQLGRDGQSLSAELHEIIARSQLHDPAKFEFVATPLHPERWSNSKLHVNRERVYDFYTKQAEHFRRQQTLPILLSAAPELDNQKGHFGNQSDEDWKDNRWNDTQLGSVQAGVFHCEKRKPIPRAVCVRLGEESELSACFNPDTLTYDAVWSGGFVSFSPFRHGFLHGLKMEGTLLPVPKQQSPQEGFAYRGYYRSGNRVVFAYRIGDVEYLDAPWVSGGQFTREVAPLKEHSLREFVDGGRLQWPQILETRIVPGTASPFAIDTIELPKDNPWKALFFCGDHDFLPDGSAFLCTMQGDVWHVSGLESGTSKPGVARWKRFASGLHQALGLVVTTEGVFVQCRDQLTRLKDLNGDGEADLYECFCNAFMTSPGGHDYICGLQRDREGYFYTASSKQGLVRMSPDGKNVTVLATGFRNPDGLGILPDGSITVPCSQGDWTPASMICEVRKRELEPSDPPPHFGFGGPKDNRPPELPLAYLPRLMDNSSGGQAVVPSTNWGPMQGQLLHFSFGMGSWFTVLRDEVNGQVQGAVLPMTGDFLSGAHRGRFSPSDGHLYVSGQQGWVSFTPDDGCFQRVRYTGDSFKIATSFHLHENGVRITFAQPVDPTMVTNAKNHFAQCWNYRYSGAYGSREFSPSHRGVPGHDPLKIASAHVLEDGRSIFLEIPEIQPVNQLHLRLRVNSDDEFQVCNPASSGHDLFITAHRLDDAFTEFPNYKPISKTIAAHPMLSDIALNAAQVPNAWLKPIEGARRIELLTDKNLTYATKELRVRAGESVAFTLRNPDSVPHNWALIRPGSFQRVGELTNQLIADPDAFARQCIPKSDDVLYYTDIVAPGQSQTIYFQTPAIAGRYPFLCTFPGHWMVMNGLLIVE
jgi:putative heme-binding domain-containing protein